MTSRNSPVRYGGVAMTFHWVIATLVILNVFLGIYFEKVLDSHDPMRRVVVGWHESIGITVLVLSVLRLGWRLMNAIPALPTDFSPVKRFFARGTHYALYTLMILVPFMGWQLASMPPRPLMLFGAIPWPKLFYIAGLSAEARELLIGKLPRKRRPVSSRPATSFWRSCCLPWPSVISARRCSTTT